MEMVSNYILKLNNKYNSNYVFCELPNELKINQKNAKNAHISIHVMACGKLI